MLASAGTPLSPIVQENLRPGDPSWVLTDPADHEVEGYASATSINLGESLKLYIHTTDPTVGLAIYRMGWYGGLGARLAQGPISLPGRQQPMPVADPVSGLIECDWHVSYIVDTSSTDRADWLSGVYLVKLTAHPSGKQSYIIFVLREDERPSDYLFQSSVTTFQAYNNWGGKSGYPSNSLDEQWARKLSFNRPYGKYCQIFDAPLSTGSGEWFLWEFPFAHWMEEHGYDVTYISNQDTHADPKGLLRARGFREAGVPDPTRYLNSPEA